MRYSKFLLFFLALVPSVCLAQGTAKVSFTDSHRKLVFVSPGLPSAFPERAAEAQSNPVDVDLGMAAPSDLVFVWDRESGNLASQKVEAIKGGWTPKSEQFTLIGQVTVHLTYQGQPVSAAQVTLKDKKRSQQQLVDNSAGGQASFFAIAPGQVTVSVQYRSEGKQETMSQLFTLDLKRSDPDPILEVAVPKATETVAPGKEGGKMGGAQPKGSAQPTQPASDGGSPFLKILGSVVSYGIGILVAIGLVYLIMNYLKNNPKTVQDQLDRFGVKVPEPPADDPNVYTPSTNSPPAQPQPAQKIILGDADPTPLTTPAAIPAPPEVSTGEPRLVRENGEFAYLSEGESTVGREDGLDISLSGEGSISRRHALLIRQGNEVSVRDLGSTNGTYVNGVKVQSDQTLHPGDTVQFGAVRFRFEG